MFINGENLLLLDAFANIGYFMFIDLDIVKYLIGHKDLVQCSYRIPTDVTLRCQQKISFSIFYDVAKTTAP